MTKSARARVTLLMLFAALFIVSAVAMPAMGTTDEETTQSTEPEETTGPTDVVVTDIEPAVEITVPAVEDTTADWTYRYLVPTGIALILLIIVITTVQYFTNVVRKRYRIVEE